jgi:hypothetical protein
MSEPAQHGAIRGLLAAEGPYAPGKSEARWSVLLGCIVLGGLIYGVCMGSWQYRPLQQMYSAIKTPLLVSAGGIFCLPSFYVVNNMLGLREDLPTALRGVLASQATVAVCLASLGPVVLIFYSGIDTYQTAKAVNGVAFLISSLGGQVVLSRHYRTLILRNPKHRIALFAWLASFWFVTIQLAWTLRPFIGSPDSATAFFREDTWGNAYVQVWKVIIGAL